MDDGSICDYLMADFDKYFCLVVQVLHLVQGTFFLLFLIAGLILQNWIIQFVCHLSIIYKT